MRIYMVEQVVRNQLQKMVILLGIAFGIGSEGMCMIILKKQLQGFT